MLFRSNFLHHNVEFELMIGEAVGINDGSECRPLFQHWDVMQEKKNTTKQQHRFYYQLELIDPNVKQYLLP